MRNQFMTLAVFGIVGLQSMAIAQSQPAADLDACKKLLDLIRTSDTDRRPTRISETLRYEQNATCYAEVLLQSLASDGEAQRRAFLKFFKDLEARRTDKQAGSSSGTGGTTNLVSKGVTARAISVAAEYGALTESVNKGIVTVSGSLEGFAAALARQSLIAYCPSGKAPGSTATQQLGCLSRGGLNFLRRVSYGISFDTGTNAENVTAMPSGTQTGTAQPVTFTANRHQISAWTGRYIILNTRDDVTSNAFGKKWMTLLQASADTKDNSGNQGPNADAVKAAGAQLLKSFQAFVNSIKLDPKTYGDAYTIAFEEFQRPEGDLNEKFNKWADQFIKLVQNTPGLVDAIVSFLHDRQAYLLAEDELVSAIAEKPVLTFEYNNNRPVGQDPTSTFRVIFDRGLGNKWSLTANGAFTIFDTRPKVANVGRLRDAQFGAQAQKDLGTLPVFGAAAVSATYYFQYQNSPAILNVTPGMPLPGVTFTGLPATATQVFAEKGNLHIGQLRLVLGPGTSSVRFPIAVSYSNRTELIAKPTWRAQIGVSYDFDSLFAR